ncbi:unnamed protein product [Mesocestoides corti]|uniref:BHLH domain-containing protein n=1 Tax=Mesocestoides corti TaxID=53468 RepID=A0A0R3UAE2_MESCO|nr:unnamed protein product [Mesocestoides corti]
MCEDIPCNSCVRSKPDDNQDQLDKERYARESHCEIERRRRNKMTAYINELCEMVPTCNSLSRKPDKLTILRMAVSHLKGLRGTSNTVADGSIKPTFLSDQELKHLILEVTQISLFEINIYTVDVMVVLFYLQAADGFLFVCQCDTGKILFVSDSVSAVLNESQSDWYQHNLYELCHPDDAEKIREQLVGTSSVVSGAAINVGCSHDQLPNGISYLSGSTSGTAGSTVSRVLDLKTGTVKKDGPLSRGGSTGLRRGFICRMKLGTSPSATQMSSTSSSAAARQARLRHQQFVLSASSSIKGDCSDFLAASQQPYALVHVTGFLKNCPSPPGSPTALNFDGYTTNHQSSAIVASLLVQLSFILFADGLSVSEMTGSGTNCQPALPNQPSQPMYFVALARLQLTNLPHAGDLMPNRSYEFTTRLSGEGIINFCDHRVLNVLQTHSPASQTISPKGLLGVPFTDLIVGAEDQAAFSDLLSQALAIRAMTPSVLCRIAIPPPVCSINRKSIFYVCARGCECDGSARMRLRNLFSMFCTAAWNSKGQQYSISLRLRLPPSSPHSSAAVTSETALHDQVAVRCTIYAFLNPYSNEVEYVVCTVTSMKCLQEAAEASEADHTFYTASYPSTSRHHQQGGEDTSYWKSSHESFALQPQPCYVTTTASAPNSQQQYDFGAGHNHHEQMSRLKFSEAGEGYPDRMVVLVEVRGFVISCFLDEVLSVDSYSQQQSAPHHPYLSGGTPYVQHPTQLPFTTASAYSTTPSPDAAACDVVTTGRTSAISYLPRPREQRDNEMQKEWYLTSDPQSYTSQHPYVLSSDQSSFLGYLHQAPAAATAASPPTYNVSSGL